MFERLPTPWGLVRSGVAPDHPKIKSVTRVYEKTAAHPRFRYYGNVTFGLHVSREDLLRHYHAIVYATGSPSDRPLGIEGEELPGSHAATEFVGWYNGHPDHTDLEVDLLSAERAVVIGNGNVAIDVARMLVLTAEELAPTDTADHALEVLAASRVKEVVVVGRRGPGAGRVHEPRAAGARRARRRRRDRRRGRARARARRPRRGTPRKTRPRGATSRSCAGTPQREPTGHAKRIVLRFLLSPVALLAGRARPPRRGRAGAQRARGGRRRRAARPGRPTSARRSRPGSSSARSATAASRCRACPSTSARA